ncbi:hypothetical protein ACJMK2_031132 [Sinanodonta woodiana]|uniref:Poly [ADP-ribose] polymerase n=1 Tax=Sinanodonta woodiana TaxID=1069815 RepID=A0ABD3WXV2_SINWO
MASDHLKHLSPKQIWEEDIKPAKILVVKNISSAITEETLHNYLEIVTREDLTSLYFYPGVSSIYLAVFKNEVVDLEEVQKKTAKRPLEKTILELLPLGGIDGLLLSNISGTVGNDGLMFYFESRKCGSQGADVKDCKQLNDLSIAVVNMNASREVFIKILNKTDHQTAGVTFAVEPYYSAFHDPVFDAIHKRNTRGVRPTMANKPSGITIPKPAVPSSAIPLNTGSSATLRPDLKPNSLQNNSAGEEGGPRQNTFHDRILTPPQSGTGAGNYMKFSNNTGDEVRELQKSSDTSQFASSSSDNNRHNMRAQTLPDSNIFFNPETRQPQAYVYDMQQNTLLGQQIFTNNCSPFPTFPDGSKSSGLHPGYSTVPDVPPSEKTKKKKKRVKKPPNPQRSISSAKEAQLPAFPPERQRQGDLGSQINLNAEHEYEIVHMTLEDIMLLILDSFQKKCTFCRVKFSTMQEEVRLNGHKSDIQKAKQMMYMTLERKKEVTSSTDVPELHLKLLVLQKTKDAIRDMLKSQRTYAFVQIKEDKHLHSYALNYQKAKSGLDLIEESLVKNTVSLREGQDKLLTGSDWTSLVQDIEQGNIVKIQQDTMNVEIGGLDQDTVQRVQNEIITFLKNKKPPNAFKQVIDGALARCFKTELADGTRDKVKNSGGSLKMQELQHQSLSDRFQIEVEVHGSDSAVEAFKTALKSIWHERLDLNTLGEDDLQLVVEALYSRGTDFIKSFEGRHHCYIDLTLPAGKPKITMKKCSAPKGDRYRITKKAESPAEYNAKTLDDASQELHLKQKMESRARLYSGLENRLHKRIGSVPNLFQTSQMSSPQDAMVRPELNKFESLDYQRMRYLQQLRRRDIKGELETLPNPEYESESITLKGLEDKPVDIRKEIKVGTVSIVVKQGDITMEQACALLNIVSPSRDLSKESVISQSFVKAGGQELITMYNNNLQLEEDEFVLTQGAGNLKCDVVLHVMLKKRVDDTETEVRKVMTTCFQKCQMFGVTTLALPPLGCGRLHRYNEDSVVKAMLEETVKLAVGNPGQLKKVTIVVYDQNLCQKYFKKLSSLESLDATPVHPFLDLTRVSQQQKEIVKQQNVADEYSDSSRFGLNDGSKNMPLLHSESSPAILHDQLKIYKQRRYSSEHQEKERTASNAFKLGASKESAVTVTVFTKDKLTCLDCVKHLEREMKENYLFQSEPVNKIHKLPSEDKKKIKDILSKYESSVLQKRVMKGVYILKGWKEEVYAAHNAILKVLSESSESTRKRKSQHKRPSSDFWMSKTFEDPETPEYWSMGNNIIKDLISNVVGKNSKRVNVDTATFQEVVKLVNDTWQRQYIGQGSDAVNLRHTQIQVTRVTRVENLDLFDLYFKKRQEIFKSLWKSKQESFPQLEKVRGCRQGIIKTSSIGKCLTRDIYPEINEYYFFHGTKVDKIDKICENGLDFRLSSEKAMLGPGVYGAESSTKADQYTDAKQARTIGEKKMFLMRMVLGNIFVCTDQNPHKYKRPPCKTCMLDDCSNALHTEGHFDSVVGDMGKLFREFVVYEKNQCYPEYIITYVRV